MGFWNIVVSTVVGFVTGGPAGAVKGAVIATATWLLRRAQDLTKPKGGGGGGGIPSGAETSYNGGARIATHVVGRAKLTSSDYLLSHVGTSDLGNNREAFNIIHVLSEGPCEGVERIWIDGYIAMEGTPNGNIQVLTPYMPPKPRPSDPFNAWQQTFFDLRARIQMEGGFTRRTASRKALEEMREMDGFRFWAIGQIPHDANRIVDSIAGDYKDEQGRNIDIVNFGSWCRAWVYPIDGVTTQTYVNSSKLVDDNNWKSSYLYKGKCMVHLQLEKSDLSRANGSFAPFGNGIPNVEYQLKGKRMTWPGQNTDVWTDNAAAVRYWFHETILEHDMTKVVRSEFDEAYNRCNEIVDHGSLVDPDDQWIKNPKRYTIDGVILQDPSYYAQYLDDMDMAWQGNVVPSNGLMRFRPGMERPAAFHIGPENIVETYNFVPGPPINDRVNAVRAVMQQYIFQDDRGNITVGDALDLPVVEDMALLAAHGNKYLERKISALRFVKNPVQAMQILFTLLQRVRSPGKLHIQCQMHPTDLDGNGGYPVPVVKDRVTVTEPDLGLTNALYEIVSWERNDDFTIDFDLQESPDGIYRRRTLDPGPLPMRRLDFPRNTTAPLPLYSLIVTGGNENNKVATVTPEGNVERRIRIDWNATRYNVVLEVTGPNGYHKVFNFHPGESDFTLEVFDNGLYEFSARNVNDDGIQSTSITASINMHTDDLVPIAPVVASADTRGDVIAVFFEPYPVSQFDVSGIQVRFRYREPGNTTAFPAAPTTDEEWNLLPVAAATAVIPQFSGDNFSINVAVRSNGRYNLYARVVTRSQHVSPIADLGDYEVFGSAPGAGTIDLHPDWAGTLVNMGQLWSNQYTVGMETRDIANALVRDQTPASGTTRLEWNGEGTGGWPFGSNTPSTFSSDEIQLPIVGNYQARVEYTTFRPPDSTVAPDILVEYRGIANGTPSGTWSSGGDGSTFTRINNVNGFQVRLTVRSDDTALTTARVFWRTRG